MRVMLLLAAFMLLTACSSTPPRVDHGKRYVRYFSTTEMAYSLYPPAGSWVYIAGKYKNENTSDITFLTKINSYVSVEVTFALLELSHKFNDAKTIERNKFFFKNAKFMENTTPDMVKTVSIGSQGGQCAKNSEPDRRHYGPSRDPAKSGKWAGGGNTRHSYQTHCPFHMNGQHFRLWMDKTIIVADAAEAAGYSVDIHALNDEIDRRFESVWQSILFNPKLSQAPLPESDMMDTPE